MTAKSEFDRYADEYDATVQAAIGASGESVAFFADLKAKLALSEARAAKDVLDFGCGVGNMSRALATRFAGARITGCDPSADSIATARARSDAALTFVATPGKKLPFDDASFDLVVVACVFHHIPGREQAHWAAEMARVLRPGGQVAFFEHNPLNPLTQRVVRNVPFDSDAVLLQRAAAEGLLEGAGFRVRRSRYYFFFPRILAALRRFEPLMGWIPFGGQYYVMGVRS